jgi:predicted  nucleic acid-binding Zn-ribbon protein
MLKLTFAMKFRRFQSRVTTTSSAVSSRRGSNDSIEAAGDGLKDRDLKTELRSLEEKYKAAMMSSAQLDNEKQSLVYQVELLKDQLEEQEESHTELQREYKDKHRVSRHGQGDT